MYLWLIAAEVEDDLREVYREVVSIQSNYYQFGIELGLPPREMDAVQKAFRQDIPQAFTEVLKVFLEHRYNVEKYGPPTWRKLVEAVDSHAGGNNHALAKKIAERHPIIKGGGNDLAQVKHHPSVPGEIPVDETTNAMVETCVGRPKGSWKLSGVCDNSYYAYVYDHIDYLDTPLHASL
jgi:hypothetical protein